MARRRGSRLGRAVAGAVAGGAATWTMDLVTSALLARESKAAKQQEEQARPNGRSAVGNLVARVDERFGLGLDDAAKSTVSEAVHYSLGVVPAALYAVLRPRFPALAAGRGLVYGLTLWALDDELMTAWLGLAAPPTDYPASTHWRGLVGHAVLGLVTDSGIALLRR